jgi:hypothetical protein
MTGGQLPPIVEHNATATGTDPLGYIAEAPGFTAFVLDEDVSTTPTRRPGAELSS